MTSSASAPVYTQLGSSSINTASAVSFSPYQINGLSTAKEFHQQQHQYENILTPSMLPAGTVLHQMPNAFATSELPMDASSSAFTTVCLPIVFNSQQYQHQQQQMPESSSAFMSLPMPNTFNGHHHHHNNHHHQHQLPEKATEQPAQQAITTYDLNNSSFQHHQNGGVQLVFQNYCAEETTNHDGSGGTAKSFSTASALHAHIQTAHNPTKPHRCLLCKAVAFAKERDLAMHMQRHSGARPHLCSLCDKAFLKRCDLLRHEQVHANRRLFKCQHCDRAFNDKSNLRGHLKRRHPD
ncbi:hypothetical protein TYRP_005015 [Tyrophagus putrescentiae]|nr:hypothetical protein TYRP_005015 [Tyrophagus putrescentiae]